jgi:hypothetical protein
VRPLLRGALTSEFPVRPRDRAGAGAAAMVHPVRVMPPGVRTSSIGIPQMNDCYGVVCAMDDDLEDVGPIDYLVVEFPGSRMTGEGLPVLVDLVDRGIIRLLDLVFVKKELDGSLTGMVVADFDSDGQLDLAVFEGASSGLLDQDDIDEAGAVLEPGSSAAILIYENSWAGPLAGALRRGGAQLVASGRIPVEALLASVEAADSVA